METGKIYFFDGNVPKFPFFLTNSPLKSISWMCHSMKSKDLQVISVLDHLSRKLPTRGLLRIYLSPKSERDFIDMLYSSLTCFIEEF